MNMNNPEYEYLHVFFMANEGYNLALIQMICENNCFNIEDHLFVTVCESLYYKGKKLCHMELSNANDLKSLVNIINLYGDRAKWIIVHSFPGEAWDMVKFVKTRYLHRIIWRTWGHDCSVFSDNILSKNERRISAANIARYIKNLIVRFQGIRRVREIYAVGIANSIDKINIEESYGDIKRYFFLPYQIKKEHQVLLEQNPNDSFDDGYYHIMIGHSGIGTSNHIEAINDLKKFANHKIYVHVNMAYGVKEYVEKVRDYVRIIFPGRNEVIEDMMTYEEYASLLNKMDAVILNSVNSCGLGNLSMILFLGKKLFLNRKGVLAKGLTFENIPFHYTDELHQMSYEELIKNEKTKIPLESMLVHQPYSVLVDEWRKFFGAISCESI